MKGLDSSLHRPQPGWLDLTDRPLCFPCPLPFKWPHALRVSPIAGLSAPKEGIFIVCKAPLSM